MAIISTEAVAPPVDGPGTTTTVTDTADAADGAGDDGGAPVIGDLEILAEIEAAAGGAEDETADDATAASAKPGDKPDEKKPDADKPIVNEAPEVRKAREILRAANRKLARANQVRDQVRNEIVNGLRTKPNATFRELGLSIGEVLDAEPGELGAEPKPQTPEERIAALEKRAKDAEAEAESARVGAQVSAAINDVHTKLRASKDFPRINAGDAHSLVTDFMLEYHREHKAPLPAARAAAIVEDFLAKLAGGQPISPAPTSKAPTSNGKQPPQQRQGSQTLDNTETRNVGPGSDDLPEDLDKRVEAVMREMGLGLNH